jgi:hypothetical protein
LQNKKLSNAEVEIEIAKKLGEVVLINYDEYINSESVNGDIDKITTSFISDYFATNKESAKQLAVKLLKSKDIKLLKSILVSSVEVGKIKFEVFNIIPELGELIQKIQTKYS